MSDSENYSSSDSISTSDSMRDEEYYLGSDSENSEMSDDERAYNRLRKHRPPSLKEELSDAIEKRNVRHLREILLHGVRGVAVEDFHINNLWYYASGYRGNLQVCRLLWQSLTSDGKQSYQAKRKRDTSPLHTAVMFAHVDIVLFFIPLINVNLQNWHGETPLYMAVSANDDSPRRLQVLMHLLDNGADPNQGKGDNYCPLDEAVRRGKIHVVRLLLERGADPNLSRNGDRQQQVRGRYPPPRCTAWAIRNGNEEILALLLQYGAWVDHHRDHGDNRKTTTTSLNVLLRNRDKSRAIKLVICQMLVNHATSSTTAAAFLQLSLENEIKKEEDDAGLNEEGCEILLEAGLNNPNNSSRFFFCAIQAGNEPACRLLVQFGADPFLEDDTGTGVENDDVIDNHHAPSPFHAAAHGQQQQQDMAILRFFMEQWNERFATTSGGKNEHGESPIQVLCRDNKHVSLQAIELLVDEFEANVSEAAAAAGSNNNNSGHHHDGGHPFLFHSAVMADASLDVVYFLLNHYPDALKCSTRLRH